MNSEELKDQILLDTHKDVAVIKAAIAEIKVDLKEHIRRTGAAEARIEQVESKNQVEFKALNRQVNMVHGALALLTLVSVLIGIYKALA